MANFSSFSPNTLSSTATTYYPTIELVADDALVELDIVIKDSNKAATGKTLDAEDSTTWDPINLTGVSTVTLNVRKIGETTIVGSFLCTTVSPLTDGHVIMSWGTTGLASLSGGYEGEIEAVYSSGKKITVQDLLRFNIRDDF
jgi:ribosomal protein S16